MTRQRSPQVLIDLIQRTKAAVRELDNLNYRKMKKILMVDSSENESTVGDADGELNVPVIIHIYQNPTTYFVLYPTDTPDEQTGGDSSKSNSITSEHSIHSMGVSASSQSSSTNSLPPADPNSRNRHKVSQPMN